MIGDLDLSKEVLWVSVSQLAAKLQGLKVGSLTKILPRSPSPTRVARGRQSSGIFFKPPTLTACNFAAS